MAAMDILFSKTAAMQLTSANYFPNILKEMAGIGFQQLCYREGYMKFFVTEFVFFILKEINSHLLLVESFEATQLSCY